MRCPDRSRTAFQSGLTLVELVVTIVITGIIAAGIAVFIQRPVEGYLDAERRAELTDEADTALRRITRDLRTALPNSVRVDASGKFIEFIESTGGGRYRAELDSGGLGNILDFTAADAAFDVIGPAPVLATGNQIVVYNLDSSGTSSNAYFGDNRAALTSTAAPPVAIASTLFPESSPARRFHVVSGPVTYGCTGGQLIRYSGYAYNIAQVAPPAGGSSAVLAGNVDVANCSFSYSAGSLGERTGTVSMVLTLVRSGGAGTPEQVRLFQQVQVNNAP
ncbi:MAG: type II secretion system protein J [Betaproteobacteria bacterium]|jgi:MSHA biogenesis protein MshO|nr:prepilin-type N-terminal cleavage/methylation domain-containing protein [Betaproteobacteria bacterium]